MNKYAKLVNGVLFYAPSGCWLTATSRCELCRTKTVLSIARGITALNIRKPRRPLKNVRSIILTAMNGFARRLIRIRPCFMMRWLKSIRVTIRWQRKEKNSFRLMCRLVCGSRLNIPNRRNIYKGKTRQTFSPFYAYGEDKMIRYVIVSAMFLTTGLLIYNLGQKQCRTEMLTARQELKENVQVEKSRIYARPNAGRSALLKLMRSGTL